MGVVGVMAGNCNLMCVCVCVCVCVVHCLEKSAFLDSELHTHTHIGLQYAAITPTTSISTDTVEPFL